MNPIKINTGNYCLLCYKNCHHARPFKDISDAEFSDSEGSGNSIPQPENVSASLKFSKVLSNYLNFDRNIQVKLCSECSILTNAISANVQQLEMAEMMLNWRLQTLGKMLTKQAAKLSLRRIEYEKMLDEERRRVAQSIRIKISEQCLTRLIKRRTSLVSVEKLDKVTSSKRKPSSTSGYVIRQFSSHPEDNMYMLSLLGCVISLWLVLSLSCFNPDMDQVRVPIPVSNEMDNGIKESRRKRSATPQRESLTQIIPCICTPSPTPSPSPSTSFSSSQAARTTGTSRSGQESGFCKGNTPTEKSVAHPSDSEDECVYLDEDCVRSLFPAILSAETGESRADQEIMVTPPATTSTTPPRVRTFSVIVHASNSPAKDSKSDKILPSSPNQVEKTPSPKLKDISRPADHESPQLEGVITRLAKTGQLDHENIQAGWETPATDDITLLPSTIHTQMDEITFLTQESSTEQVAYEKPLEGMTTKKNDLTVRETLDDMSIVLSPPKSPGKENSAGDGDKISTAPPDLPNLMIPSATDPQSISQQIVREQTVEGLPTKDNDLNLGEKVGDMILVYSPGKNPGKENSGGNEKIPAPTPDDSPIDGIPSPMLENNSEPVGADQPLQSLLKKKKNLSIKEVVDDMITKFLIEKKVPKKRRSTQKSPSKKRPRMSPLLSFMDSDASSSKKGTTPTIIDSLPISSVPSEPDSDSDTDVEPESPPSATKDEEYDSDASTQPGSICSTPPRLSEEVDDMHTRPPQEFLDGLDLTLEVSSKEKRNQKLSQLIEEYFQSQPTIPAPVPPQPTTESTICCAYLVCDTCQLQFDSRAKIEKHRVVVHNLHLYVKCPLCSCMFDSYASLEAHRKEAPSCDVREETKLLEMDDMARPIFPYQDRNSIVGNKFCPLENCYEVFANIYLLTTHLRAHGDFVCQFCSLRFEKATDLASHEHLKHRSLGPRKRSYKAKYCCGRCHEYQDSNREYMKHFLESHLNIQSETGAFQSKNDLSNESSFCAFDIKK